MEIKTNGKTVDVDAKILSPLGKLSGLMFKSKNSQNLFFENITEIHSLFVFHRFLAVWLTDDKTVVETKIVKPFRFHIAPKKPAKHLLEIPITDDKTKLIELLVDKGKV